MKTIKNFRNIWGGGYYEGNPLEPLAPSEYGALGYLSIIHAIYLMCIKPYVDGTTSVLEIGPGRGAWTKCFVERGAKKIACVDAAPAEHTGFWECVGKHENVDYHVAEDFSLSMIEDSSIDYFFSFGVFCHIHPSGVEKYLQALSTKMRSGTHGFLMIADYEKYNKAVSQPDRYTFGNMFVGRRFIPMKITWSAVYSVVSPLRFRPKDINESAAIDTAGLRWFHLGADNAARLLKQSGFEVVDQDIGISHRDPILHFKKV